MYKTESRNGERNGHANHAHAPAPCKQPARTRKRLNPPCPNCGDRWVMFQRIDRPDYLFCASCSHHFNLSEVRKLANEWQSFLDGHDRPGEE